MEKDGKYTHTHTEGETVRERERESASESSKALLILELTDAAVDMHDVARAIKNNRQRVDETLETTGDVR